MCRSLDLFLNSTQIKDYFICSICCGAICWNSWSMCKNEHIFCKQCLNDWLKTKSTCPTCYVSINKNDDLNDRVMRFWKAELASLVTKCSFKCGLTCVYESIEKHEQECSFNNVQCTQCFHEFSPNALRVHRNSASISVLESCWQNIINENKKLKEDLKTLRTECTSLKDTIHKIKKENIDGRRLISIVSGSPDLMQSNSSYRYQPSIMLSTKKCKQYLVGTWNFESSENFEEYLKAIGMGFSQRKLLNFIKPTYHIESNGYHWKIQIFSKLKDLELNFYEGVEFDEEMFDGKAIRSRVTRDIHNRLIHVQRDLHTQKLIATIIYEATSEQLVLTYDTCATTTATRIFKRKAA